MPLPLTSLSRITIAISRASSSILPKHTTFHAAQAYHAQASLLPSCLKPPTPQSRLYTTARSKMADYETVLNGKYPAKAHAKKVVEYLKSNDAGIEGVLYLEGQKTRMIEDNDGEAHFRQRRYFYYLTGCDIPDSSLVHDVQTSKSTLFIPPIDPESVIWSGLPVTTEEALATYDVDEVLTTNELSAFLSAYNTVHAIEDQISKGFVSAKSTTKTDALKTAIEDCRATKDGYEVALTRKANVISTIGHTAVMRAVKRASNERELYALWLQQSISNGAPEQAYGSIFASGTAAATLHYVRNDQPLDGKLNLLVDAGVEVDCYASDITRTFPINGKFSKESREIYDIVLKMQEDTTNTLKEGILWDDVHLHAHRIAINGLLELGILKGDKDEILKNRTSVAFFPHGLGHYLGMDTHDTGGKPNYSDPDPMFRYLRARVALPAGVIITVEPGIYFCKFIIDPYLKDPKHAKYIDEEVLKRYWEVGGVRIEDNVLITKDGFENLTTTPKSVEEMEGLINGA